MKNFCFYLELFFLGHIDRWYTIVSKFRSSNHGEIHLILDYQPLRV